MSSMFYSMISLERRTRKLRLANLLLPAILLLALPNLVSATDYYYHPPCRELSGGAAYVPGFAIQIHFDYGSGTGVIINATRGLNANNDTAKWSGGFQDAVFQTDTPNDYTVTIFVQYPQPQNQSVGVRIYSGGSVVDSDIPKIAASIITLCYHIVTNRQPQYPTPEEMAIAAAGLGCDQILACRQQKEYAAQLDQVRGDQLQKIMIFLGISFLISFYLLYSKHGPRRSA